MPEPNSCSPSISTPCETPTNPTWPPGRAALPAELKLAREFGVSRETLRRAFEVLEREGVVSREHGRGTFVRRTRVRRRGYTLSGDLDDFLHRSSLGREPYAIEPIEPIEQFSASVSSRLGGGTQGGTRVERVLTRAVCPTDC